MPKQYLNINFAGGTDTKTDPWQLAIEDFTLLKNTIFTTLKRLTKRNGFGLLLPNSAAINYLTTLNGNLTGIGSSIYALSTGLNSFVTKGTIQPVQVSTLSLIKNNNNQIQCDSAIASNGLICTAYTESVNGSNQLAYKYVIADSTTGQNIIQPTAIPVSSGAVTGSPRVFVLGSYFIVAFTNTISGTAHLQYIAISIGNPTLVTANADLASSYVPSNALSWDGVVASNTLYVAYNTTSGGQSVKVVSLSNLLSLSAAVTFAGRTATIMSVTADSTGGNLIIYASFYDSGSSTGFTLAVNNMLATVLAPTSIISSGTVLNITSAAQNGTCNVFYEVSNNYSFTAIATNFLDTVSITQAGSVSATTTITRSVGLASKAFIINGTEYVLSVQSSTYQPTYFLLNATQTLAQTIANGFPSPITAVKLAYENGGGYLTLGLPGITLNGNTAQFPYLFKDLIEVLATNNNSIQNTTGGVYSQTGIQYATIVFSTQNIDAVEQAQTLQISGGFGWMYDGYLPVEENFFLWPEVSAPTFTTVATLTSGVTTGGSNIVTSTSSISGVLPGMSITGPNIPDGQTILNTISGSPNQIIFQPGLATQSGTGLTFTVSNPASSASLATSTSTVTPTGTVTNGSNVITAVSSIANVGIGMTIAATGLSGTQFVTAFTATTITFGPGVAGSTHVATGLTLTGSINVAQLYYYQYVYEWSDNNGNVYRSAPSIPYSIATSGTASYNTVNVPTLRLTYKTANPVKIVVYRWSVATPIYFQITSITQPVLNSTAVDSVVIIDAMSDPSQNIVGASILGNNIIYTTGGVVENINSPATNVLTLFDTRAWKVDAEDQNLLWFSKQVIEAVPVEWSDLFTYFAAPNAGTVVSTGPITALAPMDDKLVIFKRNNAIYYINGNGPDNTGANSSYPPSPIFITSAVGCTNQQSIVLTPLGLMFQTIGEGIWLLSRGLGTSYIGAPVEAFNSSTITSAQNITGTTTVRFSLNTGEILNYDYFVNKWSVFEGAPSTSSCIYNTKHTLLSSYGNILQETPGVYLDNGEPVLIGFTTAWLNLAGIQGYERIYDFYLLAQYLSPYLLQIGIAYDYNPAISHAEIIRPTNFSPVVPGPFGVPTPVGSLYNLAQNRIHTKRQLCESIQFSIQEIYDPSKGVAAGAGFTMSGITARINIKKGTKPISGMQAVG